MQLSEKLLALLSVTYWETSGYCNIKKKKRELWNLTSKKANLQGTKQEFAPNFLYWPSNQLLDSILLVYKHIKKCMPS